MQPLTFNGGQPATVRLKDVSEGSFQFQIDEWNYLDGYHKEESVSFSGRRGGASHDWMTVS